MLGASKPTCVPTVVCLHGAGGGGWEWNIWRRVFAARGWRVLTPDLRPCDGGVAATRLDDYCAQVSSYCAAIAVQDLVIAGASLGGLLALREAARRPPVGVILLNPVPPAPMAAALPEQSPSPPVIEWSVSALASTLRALPDADAAACWYAWRRWRDESGDVLDRARCGIAMTLPECPSLLFASADDPEVPPECTRRLADALAGTCIDVENASHVGVLLGRGAATLAEQACTWARKRFPAFRHGAQHALNAGASARAD